MESFEQKVLYLAFIGFGLSPYGEAEGGRFKQAFN